ncbi:MAG: hypothetical protein R3A13_12875 [Bdellovibrionota bacterium]
MDIWEGLGLAAASIGDRDKAKVCEETLESLLEELSPADSEAWLAYKFAIAKITSARGHRLKSVNITTEIKASLLFASLKLDLKAEIAFLEARTMDKEGMPEKAYTSYEEALRMYRECEDENRYRPELEKIYTALIRLSQVIQDLKEVEKNKLSAELDKNRDDQGLYAQIQDLVRSSEEYFSKAANYSVELAALKNPAV